MADGWAPGRRNPYAFLLDAHEEGGVAKAWLREFLHGRALPADPLDAPPAADLLSALRRTDGRELRRPVGQMAAELLADAVEGGLVARDEEAGYLAALLALLESLPAPEEAGDLLLRLLPTGRLRGRRSERGDLHLLALRALVSKQRVGPREAERWLPLWKCELSDPSYGPTAWQGLLRASPQAALEALPAALAAWLEADPGMPLLNVAFLLRRTLGDNGDAWSALARRMRQEPPAWTSLRAAAAELKWRERAPAVWQALDEAVADEARDSDVPPTAFVTRLLLAQDRAKVVKARAGLEGPLLRAA